MFCHAPFFVSKVTESPARKGWLPVGDKKIKIKNKNKTPNTIFFVFSRGSQNYNRLSTIFLQFSLGRDKGEQELKRVRTFKEDTIVSTLIDCAFEIKDLISIAQ